MRRRAESLGAFLSHGSASGSEPRVSVHGHGHSQPCSRRCCLRGPGAAGVGISPRGTSLWRRRDSARGSGLLLPAVHTQRGDSPRARPSLRQPSGVRSRPGRRGRPEGGGAVGERPGETHGMSWSQTPCFSSRPPQCEDGVPRSTHPGGLNPSSPSSAREAGPQGTLPAPRALCRPLRPHPS